MSLLAVIPARGGSKGIPRKNIKSLCGKPLISWTIDTAKQAKCIDRIIVSTDDDEIARLAKDLEVDVPFLRPKELSTDDAPSIATVLHVINKFPDYEWVMLLQPTSPLRSVGDIEGIWELCTKEGASSAASVSEVTDHPHWMYQKNTRGYLEPLLNHHVPSNQRQKLPDTYVLNGAIYLARSKWLMEHGKFIGQDTLGFIMPQDRSIDIDTTFDWSLAEFLIGKIYA